MQSSPFHLPTIIGYVNVDAQYAITMARLEIYRVLDDERLCDTRHLSDLPVVLPDHFARGGVERSQASAAAHLNWLNVIGTQARCLPWVLPKQSHPIRVWQDVPHCRQGRPDGVARRPSP